MKVTVTNADDPGVVELSHDEGPQVGKPVLATLTAEDGDVSIGQVVAVVQERWHATL